MGLRHGDGLSTLTARLTLPYSYKIHREICLGINYTYEWPQHQKTAIHITKWLVDITCGSVVDSNQKEKQGSKQLQPRLHHLGLQLSGFCAFIWHKANYCGIHCCMPAISMLPININGDSFCNIVKLKFDTQTKFYYFHFFFFLPMTKLPS